MEAEGKTIKEPVLGDKAEEDPLLRNLTDDMFEDDRQE